MSNGISEQPPPPPSTASNAVYENVKKELSTQNYKEILSKMLETAQSNENYVTRLNDARDAGGSDMVELLKFTFPIIVELQIYVLEDLGVAHGQDGLKNFLIQANKLSHTDPEINKVFMQLRNIWLPPYK